MLKTTITIEGLDRVERRIKNAVASLEADSREAALVAAADGIRAAQDDHTYKDHRQPGKSHRYKGAYGLTDTAHAEQPRVGSLSRGFDAEMMWPAPYAGFVDKGTSRSRPYPFTPQARKAAQESLAENVARAKANFIRNAGG